MDSKKVKRARKNSTPSKKSERYRKLARIRWDKTAQQQNTNEQNETTARVSNEEDTSGNIGDNEETVDETEDAYNVWNEFGSLRDLFDDETQGTIEKVVSELNSQVYSTGDDAQENVSVVNTGLDDVHDTADKNSFESWSSDNSISSECQSEESSSEYCPTPLKKARFHSVSLENSLFICQTSQIQSFIDQINETSMCYTPHWTGKLVPVDIKQAGLGESAVIKFSCSQCTERMLNLTSSAEMAFSRRTICSFAIQVAFIAGGCMHSQYSKILKQHLGIWQSIQALSMRRLNFSTLLSLPC